MFPTLTPLRITFILYIKPYLFSKWFPEGQLHFIFCSIKPTLHCDHFSQTFKRSLTFVINWVWVWILSPSLTVSQVLRFCFFFFFFLRSTIHLYRIQRRKPSIVPSTHWVRMWTRGNLLPVPLLCHPVSIPFAGLLFTLLHSSCQWLDHLTDKNWMLGFLKKWKNVRTYIPVEEFQINW